MATTYAHHRPFLSFNPARCLRPPNRSEQFVAGKKSTRPLQNSVPERNNEPTSPRIGCMGQIKGRRSTASGTDAPPASGRTTKFRMLRKMFSDKSLGKPRSSASGAGARVHACCDMDPPLPVVRARPSAAGSGDRETSLWKRRRAGEVLEGLQVRQCREEEGDS